MKNTVNDNFKNLENSYKDFYKNPLYAS